MPSIQFLIDEFEKKKIREKNTSKNLGVVYTPLEITKYMVSNIFRIYFEDKKKLTQEIKSLKILDPSCGSGRFLISVGEYLYDLYKKYNSNLNEIEIKTNIIQNNLYGIDIDERACDYSKLRLINWVKPDINIENENLSDVFKKISFKFNIFNTDFLLDYQSKNFDIIIGNPPYIENKKISKSAYKSNLIKKFKSAYKLFDLSILFIEKAISILKEHEGCLAFLTPNKFLAADYGVRIRELLLKETQIKEIINISSLRVFQNTSAYPLILFLKKEKNNANFILIKKFNDINHIPQNVHNNPIKFSQSSLNNFPSRVIPISGNIEQIGDIFSNYNSLSEAFKDLKIIYRPYGFIDWSKNSKYVKQKNTSPKDLILLGTGNVGKFYIDFNKPIRIAHTKYQNPYFKYQDIKKEVWKELSDEKLIFREIARNLTFVYDPGIFTNLTGLYFLKIPSFNTDQLFGLLVLLNSQFLNSLFKSLYGTLHMAGGYLRFNGSFIKKLPIPKNIPSNISYIGRILQFLNQLKYEILQEPKEYNRYIKTELINELIEFYDNLVNRLVNHLYFFKNEVINTEGIPRISFKFIKSYSKSPRFESYSEAEILENFVAIRNFYNNTLRIT